MLADMFSWHHLESTWKFYVRTTVCIHPPQPTAMYSFMQLNELEQCGVKKLTEGLNAVKGTKY